MQEISHSDLVTRVRNCDGMVLVHIGGEDYCCNPTEQMRKEMIDQAGRMAERAEESDEEVEDQTNPPEPESGVGGESESDQTADLA